VRHKDCVKRLRPCAVGELTNCQSGTPACR